MKTPSQKGKPTAPSPHPISQALPRGSEPGIGGLELQSRALSPFLLCDSGQVRLSLWTFVS